MFCVIYNGNLAYRKICTVIIAAVVSMLTYESRSSAVAVDAYIVYKHIMHIAAVAFRNYRHSVAVACNAYILELHIHYGAVFKIRKQAYPVAAAVYGNVAYGVAVAVEKSVQIFNGCISCREVKVCGKQIDSRRIVVCKFCVVFFNGAYFLNIYLLAVNLRRNSCFAVGEPVVYGVSSLVFIFKLGSYRIIGKVNR